MRIEYIGHSCFYFVTRDGTRIIIDPYDNSIGLTPVNREADVALVTHHHFDHDYLDGVHGEYVAIDGPGSREAHGVRITGFELDHDPQGGALRGKVTAYLIEVDGIRLLHMGDVGTMPPDSFFDQIGAIDVLMIPVGGTYTVDAAEAFAICERINPAYVIPMHYKTTRLKLDVAPVNGFVELATSVYDIVRQGSVLTVERNGRKKHSRVVLMENSF